MFWSLQYLRFTATPSLGSHTSYPICRIACLDFRWWLHTDVHTHIICTPVSPVAGTLSPRPLSSVVLLQLPARRPPCLRTYTEKALHPGRVRNGVQWEDRTKCTSQAQGMVSPCLQVTSLFYPLIPPFSHSFASPAHLDPPFPAFGSFPKHPLISLFTIPVQSQDAFPCTP